MRRPLIPTQDLDALVAFGLLVLGPPLWAGWRLWRYLRTGA